MRRTWIALTAGLALVASSACVQQNVRLSKKLVVASDLENPPFAAFDDATGDASGRDVEMMERLCEELELELSWSRVPFDQLLDEVESGGALMACATLGVTPERQERVLFSNPYYRTRIAVLTRNDAGAPQGIADLSGRRVVAGRGTTSERAVQSRVPGAVLVTDAKEELSPAELLLAGEIDAAVMDGPNADRLAAESGGALRVLDEPLADELYAIAIKKEHGYLKDRVDRALQQLDDEGFLEELDSRWGL